MKTILFPTDFSANAHHAAKYAGMLASNLHAQVVLLNVYSVPMVSEYQLPTDIEKWLEENRKAAEVNLAEFRKAFVKEIPLPEQNVMMRVEYGFISDKIVDIAQEVKADMIVMGTKGAHNLIDRWLGTNAQKVMKAAHCPVWIIPEKAALKFPSNILYAADFQEDEVAATHTVMEIARSLYAHCNVLHLHDYFELNVGHQVEAMAGFLEDEFEKDDISVAHLKRQDILKGLETYVNTHKPDVLAMAVHDKSFFNRIFEKSITKHFVQEAKLPILTFRK
jgi:nucleotide-binding universal stress UspA family protein